jgi:hypothetical protein
MEPNRIFAPMLALVALTFVVLLNIPLRRFRAALQRKVSVDDFKYGESAAVPAEVSIPNRNYMNLLELPLLFYVACLTLFVTRQVDAAALGLAWLYVGLRVVHSLVHLTYNRVIHRLAAFTLSNVVLSVVWLRFALAVL